ncbi:MAG: retropepsin-like aspartic protease [Bacteroidales bacterium]
MVKVKFKIVELEPENYHIVIKGKIDNQPVNLVVDTGASHSCFDLDFIKSLNQATTIENNEGMNVGVGSSDFESKISTVFRFKLGRFEMTEYTVVLLDLQHINAAYKTMKLPLVQGILGSDFFVKYGVVIDYQNQCLTIQK